MNLVQQQMKILIDIVRKNRRIHNTLFHPIKALGSFTYID